jgi:hypothetical protein
MTRILLDDERQPLLNDNEATRSRSVKGRGLPWSQIVIQGIWRATHASGNTVFSSLAYAAYHVLRLLQALYFGHILTW